MTTWIIPCNVRFFDIEAFLNSGHDEVVWQTASEMKINEPVYIYLAGGPSEIRYKGYIKEINLDEKTIQENSYAIRFTKQQKNYVLIKIEHSFSNKALSLNNLREHGLKQYQRQSRASNELIEYIELAGNDNKS